MTNGVVGCESRLANELTSELNRNVRACWDVSSGNRGLLASDTAAYGFKFEAGVLGGFDCSAEGFAYERWDFDAALLDVEDHRAAGREFRLRWRLRIRDLSRLCGRSFCFAYCGLDHICSAVSSRGRGRSRHIRRLLRLGTPAVDFSRFQRFAGVIGSVVSQVFVLYLGLRQQELMFRP